MVLKTKRLRKNNMEHQKVAVFDCDDVLADLSTIVLERASFFLKRPVHLSECVHYDLNKVFGDFFDVNKMFLDIALEDISPTLGAKTLTRLLKENGWKTIIVTARGYHENAAARTLQWSKDNGILIDEIHVVPLFGEKRQVLGDLGKIDIYVEDNHDHVEAAHNLPNVRDIFLMNRPWNTNCPYGTRVNHLADVINYIKKNNLL